MKKTTTFVPEKTLNDMKKIIALTCAVIATLAAASQSLPQLAYNSYQGWTYSGGVINESSFSRGLALYVTSQNNALTLMSPEFSCEGMDSISVVVRGKSQGSGCTLTTALDTPTGEPQDSVMTLTTSASASVTLSYAIAVPQGMTTAILRFTSWDGTLQNCISIKSIELTAVSSSTPPQVIPGDLDGSGSVSINDVTLLIDYLLNGLIGNVNAEAADVDGDSNISISDVTALIDLLLS